jgi:CheY-like chemotaxis protein
VNKDIKSILIAEDNDMLRETYKEIFIAANYGVDTAVNGSEAFNLIRNKDYDLVFTDFSMPYLTGVELLNQCQDMKKPIPAFILNTGHSNLAGLGDTSKFSAVLRKSEEIGIILKTIADAIKRTELSA